MSTREIDWDALGHRALDCGGWSWMPGALTMNGDRVIDEQGTAFRDDDYEETIREDSVQPFDIPDFRDAATRGCLLEQVRAKLEDPYAFVGRDLSGDWAVFAHLEGVDEGYTSPTLWCGECEVDAMLAVLEDRRHDSALAALEGRGVEA